MTNITPPQRILYCVISVGRKKHHFKYLFVHEFVFMGRSVIASDGTRLAPHGVDQHWLMVQGDGWIRGVPTYTALLCPTLAGL
jgi:hypothetical protein